MRWAQLAVAVTVLWSCAPRALRPAPRRAFATARAEADRLAAADQLAAADSVLEAYALAHPDAADSLDVLFYRALYNADPANADPNAAREAIALLDRYLSAAPSQPHRAEAQALRRLAELRDRPPEVRVDTVRAVDTAAMRQAVAREVEARDRVRDEDSQRLRDSLARTTAELERIRRRLAPRGQ